MPTNGAPYEIMGGPIEVYRAPLATAFPATITTAPAAGWVLIGTNGSKNYNESGVIIRRPKDVSTFYSLGRTGPAKTFLNQEGIEVEFVLTDFTAEAWAMAQNKDISDIVEITPSTGIPGEKSLPNINGFGLKTYALLLRAGTSPYMEGGNTEVQIPMVQQIGAPEIVWRKNEPIGLQLIFRGLEDPANGFGKTRYQTAAAA